MKKILVLFLILVSVFSLGGCAQTNVTHQTQEESMFVIVENTEDWKIVYNKRTKVMYAVSEGGYSHGIFTLLVNSDGTPMLWGEE